MEPITNINPARKGEKGFLISFEGIDFCGKSTQIDIFVEELDRLQIPVIVLREPGATEISEKVRNILLDNKNHIMTSRTELLLYSAARAQLVMEKIIPAVERGEVVILDRFFDSTTAYQGYGREIDLDFINKLNIFATCGMKPDITFLIDLDPEIALKRKDTKAYDRLEQEDISFHKRVRDGFLEISDSEADRARFVVINGEMPINAITKVVFKHFEKILSL